MTLWLFAWALTEAHKLLLCAAVLQGDKHFSVNYLFFSHNLKRFCTVRQIRDYRSFFIDIRFSLSAFFLEPFWVYTDRGGNKCSQNIFPRLELVKKKKSCMKRWVKCTFCPLCFFRLQVFPLLTDNIDSTVKSLKTNFRPANTAEGNSSEIYGDQSLKSLLGPIQNRNRTCLWKSG